MQAVIQVLRQWSPWPVWPPASRSDVCNRTPGRGVENKKAGTGLKLALLCNSTTGWPKLVRFAIQVDEHPVQHEGIPAVYAVLLLPTNASLPPSVGGGKATLQARPQASPFSY